MYTRYTVYVHDDFVYMYTFTPLIFQLHLNLRRKGFIELNRYIQWVTSTFIAAHGIWEQLCELCL